MLLRSPGAVLLVAISIILGGCPPQTGLGLSQGALGPLVTTNIPAGIYVGELSMATENAITGQTPVESVQTKSYHEVVNENGLPLFEPGSIVPRTGVVIPLDLGDAVGTYTIESVETSGNRLLMTYTASLAIAGVSSSGYGSVFYEFAPPSTLTFTEQLTVASSVVNGRIWTFTYTASATLTK
jgi:hypothetical protein